MDVASSAVRTERKQRQNLFCFAGVSSLPAGPRITTLSKQFGLLQTGFRA